MPIDKYHDALLTPKETARHSQLPSSTLNHWLRDQAAGEALVHRVPPVKRGWPSAPFIAVIEAYVLRSLRDLGLSKKKIHDAAAAVRREFKTSYGLATQRIATDGIDISSATLMAILCGRMTGRHRSATSLTSIFDTSPGMRWTALP